MELSIVLAQVFGLYFVATGIAALLRGKELRAAVDEFKKSHTSIFLGAVLVLFGLFLVLNHNIWDGTWKVWITIISWLTLLEGLVYLWLPRKAVGELLDWFNTRWWYIVGTLFALILGAYLISIGFGMM